MTEAATPQPEGRRLRISTEGMPWPAEDLPLFERTIALMASEGLEDITINVIDHPDFSSSKLVGTGKMKIRIINNDNPVRLDNFWNIALDGRDAREKAKFSRDPTLVPFIEEDKAMRQRVERIKKNNLDAAIALLRKA